MGFMKRRKQPHLFGRENPADPTSEQKRDGVTPIARGIDPTVQQLANVTRPKKKVAKRKR